MRNLDMDQLKTFVTIGETGNFSEAARALHKTQSAVSMQMKRLEETVNLPLFKRDGRYNRLTKHGKRLLDYARRIAALNDEAVNTLVEPGLSGTVRLGLPSYAAAFLPALLEDVAAAFPDLSLEIVSQESDKLLRNTLNGKLDLSLLTHRSADGAGDIIRREPLVWAAGPAFAARTEATIPLAAFNLTSYLRALSFLRLEEAGLAFRVVLSSSDTDTLCASLLTGDRVALLPRVCLRPGMRVLGEKEGMPSLPALDIALLLSTESDHESLADLGTIITACLAED